MHAIGRTDDASISSCDARSPVSQHRSHLAVAVRARRPLFPGLARRGGFPVADCSARILQSLLERGRRTPRPSLAPAKATFSPAKNPLNVLLLENADAELATCRINRQGNDDQRS